MYIKQTLTNCFQYLRPGINSAVKDCFICGYSLMMSLADFTYIYTVKTVYVNKKSISPPLQFFFFYNIIWTNLDWPWSISISTIMMM